MATRTPPEKAVNARKGGFGANVSAAAALHGQLPANQQSEIIYFASLGPCGLVCLWLAIAYSSLLAGALSALCFVPLVAVVVVRLIRTSKEAPNPSTVAVAADGTTSISGHIAYPDRLALTMRRMLLARNDMPRPNGEISGNAADEKAVRRYTPEEQQAVVETISREIEESDRSAIDHARRVMAAALPPPGPVASQPQLEAPAPELPRA